MADDTIRAGTILRVETFDSGQELTVQVEDSHPVGRGGSSVVLAGKVNDTAQCCMLSVHVGKRVALKVFRTQLFKAEQEMLRRELVAARSIQHHRILAFIGTSAYGLHTVLVSPLMSNGNLLQHVNQNIACDRGHFLLQVAEALDFLHNKARLVHGDVKCENVLVSDSNDALLADLGLSTAVEKADSEQTTTLGIRVLHTVRFAAPELLEDGVPGDSGSLPHARRRSKTTESDVYAFGMFVLQLYTGEKPWNGVSDISVILKVSRRETPPRPTATSRLSDVDWELCNSCWKWSPPDRPVMRTVHKALRLQLHPNASCFGRTPELFAHHYPRPAISKRLLVTSLREETNFSTSPRMPSVLLYYDISPKDWEAFFLDLAYAWCQPRIHEEVVQRWNNKFFLPRYIRLAWRIVESSTSTDPDSMKVELWCDSQPIPTDSPAQAIPGHARSQELQPKEDDVQIWGEEMFRAGSPFQLPVMLSPVLVPPSPTSTIRSATALTGLASHGVDSPVSDGGLSLVSGPPTSASSGRARGRRRWNRTRPSTADSNNSGRASTLNSGAYSFASSFSRAAAASEPDPFAYRHQLGRRRSASRAVSDSVVAPTQLGRHWPASEVSLEASSKDSVLKKAWRRVRGMLKR